MFSLCMCIAVEKTAFLSACTKMGTSAYFRILWDSFPSLAVIFITCADGYSDFNFTLYTDIHNYETAYHTVFFFNKPF